MGRPTIKANDRLEYDFRLRLNESDNLDIRKKAKILGVTPTTFIRMLVKKAIADFNDDSLKFSIRFY